MKLEREQAERETMEIIKATRTGDITEAILRASAMSYAMGLRQGAAATKNNNNDNDTAA